jgi:chemotaxis protein methyltransferase CheR
MHPTMPNLLDVALSQRQFDDICRFLYQSCGIKLNAGKEGLVKSRLVKRLRMLGLSNFDEYLKYVKADSSGRERTTMIDALTTNKTSFFRELPHFDYLRQEILPVLLSQKKTLRFWSAGCSSGEEPYTLAILLNENIPDLKQRDVRILATDISTKVLDTAREGLYDLDALQDVPPKLLGKYFSSIGSGESQKYRVQPSLQNLIRFAQLNLMGEWPMKGAFDVILCRNVMIYFDKPTQQWLVDRFWQLLEPGGHLFVGHSESLTGTIHQFRYVQPATYKK